MKIANKMKLVTNIACHISLFVGGCFLVEYSTCLQLQFHLLVNSVLFPKNHCPAIDNLMGGPHGETTRERDNGQYHNSYFLHAFSMVCVVCECLLIHIQNAPF